MSSSFLKRLFGRADSTQALADAREHKGAGDALLHQGDYAAAEARYRAAIAAAPGAPDIAPAHTNLGYALHAQERVAEASDALRRALAVDETQADAHYLAAVIARAEERAADAERHYRLTLRYAPDMEAACLELCTLLAAQKRFADALAPIEAMLARQPEQAQLRLFRGNLQQELGQYAAAIATYRQAAAHEPDSQALQNNLGLALQKAGDAASLQEAVAVFERLVDLAPQSADAHSNLGNARLSIGDHAGAMASLERAVALDPNLALAHFNMGNTLLARGDAAGAFVRYERALAADPGLADVHFRWGAALQDQDRLDEADEHYRAALELAPTHTDALLRRGFLLQKQERLDAALDCYDQVLVQQSRNSDALFNRGIALRALAETGDTPWRKARIADAEGAYRDALAAYPAHIPALNNLAILLQERGDFAASIALFEKIVALDPRFTSAHHNLGVSFEGWARRGTPPEKLARFEQAVAHYRNAFACDAKHVDSLLGVAAIKSDLMQQDEALALYDQILAIDPDFATAHFNRGMLLLGLGRFTEGWREYEYRWDRGKSLERLESSQPHWQRGIDLAGRTLLLYAEQGLGDNLQFVRYAKVLAGRGATVWLRVPPPLTLLFASCPGVARVFTAEDEIPPYDYLCPMLSVPGIVDTVLDTIPSDVPYLRAAPERVAYWRERLGPKHEHELNVGLVWAGNPRKDQPADEMLMDSVRSLHFDQIRPLLDVPGVRFHSLQVGRDATAQAGGTERIADHAAHLFDFQETAALVENLDLVISVDTSTAHLAGAIGKPVWLLNRLNTDWRWLHGRSDSPWYPTMRLFRQPKAGDWDSVIAAVRVALLAEADKASRRSPTPSSRTDGSH